MDQEAYRAGITSLYTAEVLGEGLASRWLELSTDSNQRDKLALFLQLESEAKIRLRPLLARLGLNLVEDQAQRAAGATAAETFASMSWTAAMAELADLAKPYRDRFQALLDAAPPADAPLVRFMVHHESSVIQFAQREARGEGSMEDVLLPMLMCPLARPSSY